MAFPRSKASTTCRPQRNCGKKAAVQPHRLLIDHQPSSRTTSPESIGEQIEVEAEDRSTLQAHPLSGESSDGSRPPSPALSHISYHSNAHVPVHSCLLNHSFSSTAHNERCASPAGSGSVSEASSGSERPESYTNINNASLRALLSAQIPPFTNFQRQ